MGTTGSAVRAEQIRTLYRQSLPVLAANVANAALVSAALWSSAPRTFLLAWTGVMALMTAARLWLRRRYWRARPAPEQAPRWAKLFVAGTAVAGILWGIAAAVLFDRDQAMSQVLIAFVIGGMGAGAAGTISVYQPAFFAYLLPSVAPLTIRMLSLGGTHHLAMGGMLIVYALAMSAVARTTNRSLRTAFRLRFENEDLVAQLSRAQESLEETNRTLEKRVAERSLALEQQSEALRNAQRMEAVGRLAGGIAHDFNNLLTVVLSNTSRLLDDRSLTAAARLGLEDVRAAAIRGAELVRQLLAFSRRQRLLPKLLDVNRVVLDVQRLLVPLIGESIELGVATAPEPLSVKADASQLDQVIVNLVTNARDAMKDGGKLTIATAKVQMGAGHSRVPPGAYALLSVIDTGIGMDAETRRHAFDPFFTTKGPGQGTGLGLATVHGIVEQSGGHITLQSEPAGGSRFDVYLPYAPQTEPAEPPAAVTVFPAARPATILVAEDEPMVRSVITAVLETAGHKVLAAQDGEQALAMLQAHPAPIDLLVSDVVMATLGGPELARRVRALRPDVRVLFISGYAFETDLTSADPSRGVDFLQKPFTSDGLMEKVSLVLSRPR